MAAPENVNNGLEKSIYDELSEVDTKDIYTNESQQVLEINKEVIPEIKTQKERLPSRYKKERKWKVQLFCYSLNQ